MNSKEFLKIIRSDQVMVAIVKISLKVIVHAKSIYEWNEIMPDNFLKTAKIKRDKAIHRNNWKNVENCWS